jgi:hypothetical protein
MDLKQFEQLIKMCRKYGVTSATVEGISLQLADEAPQSNYKRKQSADVPAEQSGNSGMLDFDQLTDEEKLFWSSAPKVAQE